MIGLRFGALVALERAGTNKQGQALWKVRCDCGTVKSVSGSNLRRPTNPTKSCGCQKSKLIASARTIHGAARRKQHASEYDIWNGMKARCRSKKMKRYGARGIQVCAQWMVFANFLADVGARPSLSHTLDRFPNNDGNYEPGNVRWAIAKEQSANSTRIRSIEFRGEVHSIADWSRLRKIPYSTLAMRLRHMPPARALTLPYPALPTGGWDTRRSNQHRC